MRLQETVFYGVSVCVALTALLLAIPFPRSIRVVLSLYLAPFVVFAASVVYCVTVAAPFIDSVAWYVDGAHLRATADPARMATANQDLYKGLLALAMVLSLALQRMHVSSICNLQEKLRITKLNLDVTLKQAKGMSAASLSMLDQLAESNKNKTSESAADSKKASDGDNIKTEATDEQIAAVGKLRDVRDELKTAQASIEALKAQSAALEREYQRTADELETTKRLVPPALRGTLGDSANSGVAAEGVGGREEAYGSASSGGAVRRRSRASKDD